MSAPDVSPHLVTQFSDMVHVAAQQMQSRFKPYCVFRDIKGDDAAYDGLGDVQDSLENGRQQAITFSDIEHTRRKIARNRYYVALPIDDMDKLGMLIDPQSKYAESVAKAMYRRLDRVVVAAAFADVLTGRNFADTVNFATDGGKTVDATGGLTYEKLLEIEQNWIDNEVGNDMPVKKLIAISGNEHKQLMQEAELTSGDFSRSMAVDKGELVKAAGFDVIKFGASQTNPILNVNTGVRSCIALAQNAICVGISRDIKIEIEKRTDLLNTYQVVCSYILGAVRTEGKLVQKITTTVPA